MWLFNLSCHQSKTTYNEKRNIMKICTIWYVYRISYLKLMTGHIREDRRVRTSFFTN